MSRPDGDGPTSLGTLSTEEVRPELGSLDLLALPTWSRLWRLTPVAPPKRSSPPPLR